MTSSECGEFFAELDELARDQYPGYSVNSYAWPWWMNSHLPQWVAARHAPRPDRIVLSVSRPSHEAKVQIPILQSKVPKRWLTVARELPNDLWGIYLDLVEGGEAPTKALATCKAMIAP